MSADHNSGNIVMRDEVDGALIGDHPPSLSASVPILSKSTLYDSVKRDSSTSNTSIIIQYS